MVKMATKSIDTASHGTLIRQVRVPDQELKPVREAYETAALLNGALALFIEAVVNKDGIKKADKERNVLAVALVVCPKRKDGIRSTLRMQSTEAKSLGP